MKTIFAKYNNERLPKYQIVTKIAIDENGEKYALKEALCDESNEHINNIYRNYELLKSTYNINLVKPKIIENGVQFEMAEGKSLENILLDTMNNNDNDKFKKYIDKFLDFVDSMVYKRNVLFEPSFEFETIFGKWEITKNQDIIKVANIDLIFGNIFVNTKDEFTLIDYEWVFDFEVPKNYVIWRSFETFKSFHSNYYSFDLFNDNINFQYEKSDIFFSNFVRGINKKYFLSSKVEKNVNFVDFNKKESFQKTQYFVQLFIEDENGLSEENSIKYLVVQNNEIQKFEFDLRYRNNIKSLRLDPLNDYCVIKINEIRFNNIIYEDSINTNAIFKEDNLYYFNTDDSQIYINLPLDIAIEIFSIEIQYLKIGEDAISDISNILFKRLLQREQNIQNLNEELENRDESIENLKNKINKKEQNIQNLNEELENRDESIENLKNKINKKEQNIQNLNEELENRDESIENLKNKINKKEQNIQNLTNKLNQNEQIIQEKLLDIEIIKEKTKLYYPNLYNKFFKGLN